MGNSHYLVLRKFERFVCKVRSQIELTNDADAHRRVTGFKALQSGHGVPEGLDPGFQRLLAAQAAHSQAGAKLFNGGCGGRRMLLKSTGCSGHT